MTIKAMVAVMEETAVSGNEFAVLMVMADGVDDLGQCFRSVEEIARLAHVSERTVQRVCDRLERDGLIAEVVDEEAMHPRAREIPARYRPRVWALTFVRGGPSTSTRGDKVSPLEGRSRGDKVSPRGGSRGDKSGSSGVTPVSPNPNRNPSSSTSLRSVERARSTQPTDDRSTRRTVRVAIKDALAATCYGTTDGLTKSEWGRVEHAAKEIHDVLADKTPDEITDEIAARAKRYRRLYEGDVVLTPQALTNNWSKLAGRSRNGGPPVEKSEEDLLAEMGVSP